MHYQDDQIEEPTMISTSRDYRYPPSQYSPMKSVLKHGFLAGAILAGIVIVTTTIFTNPVVSDAFFSTFTRSYFFGLVSQGDIIISLIITALCAPVYFFTGYFTRKYSAFACLIILKMDICIWEGKWRSEKAASRQSFHEEAAIKSDTLVHSSSSLASCFQCKGNG